MKRQPVNTAFSEASIVGDNGIRIDLILTKDGDGAYRWYESGTGADTEVSGKSIREAIQAARAAWRSWEFSLEKRGLGL